MREYPTAERLRELFSYDSESGRLLYRIAPYRKPALLGKPVGTVDKRDGSISIRVDGNYFSLKTLVVIYVTGNIPDRPSEVDLTLDRLRAALAYNSSTGEFTRSEKGRGIRLGARADYKESNGYRYVNLDGKSYLAARLAWFYVNGEWPERMLRFQDGDNQNCAISNLAYGEFDQSTYEGRRAYEKARRRTAPHVYRGRDLKRDFGISLEQYQAAFVAQGGVCAICANPETEMRGGKVKWLAVDHDHSDNTFRGLLCASCNLSLGRMQDNPETLRNAAAYLEAHASKPKTNVIPLSARRAASKGK